MNEDWQCRAEAAELERDALSKTLDAIAQALGRYHAWDYGWQRADDATLIEAAKALPAAESEKAEALFERDAARALVACAGSMQRNYEAKLDAALARLATAERLEQHIAETTHGVGISETMTPEERVTAMARRYSAALARVGEVERAAEDRVCEQARIAHDAFNQRDAAYECQLDCMRALHETEADLSTTEAWLARALEEFNTCRWQHVVCDDCGAMQNFIGQGLYECWKCEARAAWSHYREVKASLATAQSRAEKAEAERDEALAALARNPRLEARQLEAAKAAHRTAVDSLREARAALETIRSAVVGELDRGYVLTHEPGAGSAWRARWNGVLGKVEAALASGPAAPEQIPFGGIVDLWDAINEYASACGGMTDSTTVGNRRMNAVARVESAVRALASAPAGPPEEKR